MVLTFTDVFDIFFGNKDTDAEPSDLILLVGEEKSNHGSLRGSSLFQGPRNGKMGQRKEDRGRAVSTIWKWGKGDMLERNWPFGILETQHGC